MKDTFGPILVIALLVAGAWYGVTRYMGRSSVQGASIPATAETSKETKDKPGVKASSKHRAPKHGEKSGDPVEQAMNAAEPAPIIVDVPNESGERVARRFPSVAELPPGTDRLQVRNRFGRPDIQATTVNRGALMETYLYHSRNEGRTTIVYLKDGRVQRTQAMP